MFFPTPYRDECFVGHSLLCMITVLNWLTCILIMILIIIHYLCVHICHYACIDCNYLDFFRISGLVAGVLYRNIADCTHYSI